MIAQDFFRVRVLASGNIAAVYGVPVRGKKTSEGAAALSVTRANVKDGTYLIEMQ